MLNPRRCFAYHKLKIFALLLLTFIFYSIFFTFISANQKTRQAKNGKVLKYSWNYEEYSRKTKNTGKKILSVSKVSDITQIECTTSEACNFQSDFNLKEESHDPLLQTTDTNHYKVSLQKNTTRLISVVRIHEFADDKTSNTSQSLPVLTQLEAPVHRYECIKRIIYFGLRPKWCTHPRLSQPRQIACPDTNCAAVVGFTNIPEEIKAAHAVVFTNVFEWLLEKNWTTVIRNRSKNQKWIMITQESALYVPGLYPPMKFRKQVYDWTDTFKRDATFYSPYGYFQPFNDSKPELVPYFNEMRHKSKLLVWVASHCETLQWDRLQFALDLQKLTSLDIYGKCGTSTCGTGSKLCSETLLSRYKFVLSLENSCCDDYITEKFWRALKFGIVPIVVGASYHQYKRTAPPNSFIHVDEFDSIVQLADYIFELDIDPIKYASYFKWRGLGTIVTDGIKHFYKPIADETVCKIVKKLRDRHIKQSGEKFDSYGPNWKGSCSSCGQKKWIQQYQYASNHKRINQDIWA